MLSGAIPSTWALALALEMKNSEIKTGLSVLASCSY